MPGEEGLPHAEVEVRLINAVHGDTDQVEHSLEVLWIPLSNVGVEQRATHVSAVQRLPKLYVLPELALQLLWVEVVPIDVSVLCLLHCSGTEFCKCHRGLFNICSLEAALAPVQDLEDGIGDSQVVNAFVALGVARSLPLRWWYYFAQTIWHDLWEYRVYILGEVLELVPGRPEGRDELH